MFEPVTVITLTRGREAMLRRAIRSVMAQDYKGEIEHLILIDDDPEPERWLSEIEPPANRSVTWDIVDRPASEKGAAGETRASIYPRLARLLNRGAREASSPWLSFLDDDNLYEPDHISSLIALAERTNGAAIHSARTMHWRTGEPYLETIFPGAPNREEGERLYQLMCRRGVWERGTNILRDRVDADAATFANSTVMSDDDPIFLVDQNLWLVRRSLLLEHPIDEMFSEDEIAQNTCPDDKMLENLVRAGVPIHSTGRPTVRYFLGGVSNGDEQVL